MEQSGIDPRVDKALKSINATLRGPAVCPFCGNTNWDVSKAFLRPLLVAE